MRLVWYFFFSPLLSGRVKGPFQPLFLCFNSKPYGMRVLFEGFVGGKYDRTAFVALTDDLEEQVGSALVDGKIANLVEEQ